MKIRSGFVSNSSSSSFIVYSNIKTVTKIMHDIIFDEDSNYEEPEEKKIRSELKKTIEKNIKKALQRKDVINGKIGIVMPSCNYDTYILQEHKRCIINTSNNYQWPDSWMSNGEDGFNFNGKFFYDVKRDMIRSHEVFIDDLNRKCPKCDNSMWSYVSDKNGNMLCSNCFQNIGEKTLEKAKKIFRKNNPKFPCPITSLKLDS